MEPGRSVLAAIADGHVRSRNASYWSLLQLVTSLMWSGDRLSDMSWMTSATSPYAGLLALRHIVDKFIIGNFSSIQDHCSRRCRRGGRSCCSLLHCGPISVVLRKVEAD